VPGLSDLRYVLAGDIRVAGRLRGPLGLLEEEVRRV